MSLTGLQGMALHVAEPLSPPGLGCGVLAAAAGSAGVWLVLGFPLDFGFGWIWLDPGLV